MGNKIGNFWLRETATGQQVAQLHERYVMMMIMMMKIGNIRMLCARSRNHSCSGNATRILFYFFKHVS